jgi:hypothetical protein
MPFPRPHQIRMDGTRSARGGIPGNRGNWRGQVIRSGTDQKGHTVSECWELLFVANAQAPAPFKMTDAELSLRMFELFPGREWCKLFSRPHVWRNAYNKGELACQRRRSPLGKFQPPEHDLFSYRYERYNNAEALARGEDVPPYDVYALGPRGKCMYRVFPPEPQFKYEELAHLFTIPKQDWNQFPYPQEAKRTWKDMRKERVEKEKAAFQDFVKEWMKKQRKERPQDFDPLLWEDPKW